MGAIRRMTFLAGVFLLILAIPVVADVVPVTAPAAQSDAGLSDGLPSPDIGGRSGHVQHQARPDGGITDVTAVSGDESCDTSNDECTSGGCCAAVAVPYTASPPGHMPRVELAPPVISVTEVVVSAEIRPPILNG